MMFVESYVHLFTYLVKSMTSFCLIVVLTRFLYSVLFQYFIMLLYAVIVYLIIYQIHCFQCLKV